MNLRLVRRGFLSVLIASAFAANSAAFAQLEGIDPEYLWSIRIGEGRYGVEQWRGSSSGSRSTTLFWGEGWISSPLSAPAIAGLAAAVPAALLTLGALGFAYGKRRELRAERPPARPRVDEVRV